MKLNLITKSFVLLLFFVHCLYPKADEVFLLKTSTFATYKFDYEQNIFELKEGNNFRNFQYLVTIKPDGRVTVHEQADNSSKWNTLHKDAAFKEDNFFVRQGDLERHITLNFADEEMKSLKSFFLCIKSDNSYFYKSTGSWYGQTISAGTVLAQNPPLVYSDTDFIKMDQGEKWAYVFNADSKKLGRKDLDLLRKNIQSVNKWNQNAGLFVKTCQDFVSIGKISESQIKELNKIVSFLHEAYEEMEEIGEKYDDNGLKRRARKLNTVYLEIVVQYSYLNEAMKESNLSKYNAAADEAVNLAKLKVKVLSDFRERLTNAYPNQTNEEIRRFEKEWGVKFKEVIN